jgi:hypothetical protein
MMRKRLALVSIAVLGVVGVAAGSAAGQSSCPHSTGPHPLGIACTGFFVD